MEQPVPPVSSRFDNEDGDIALDIAKTATGDDHAFCRIYRVSAGRLFAICINITRERGAAEELLQDTFIKIWIKAPSYDPIRARPMAWLSAIARNSAIDWYRSRPKQCHVHEDHLIFVRSEEEAADDCITRKEREGEAWRLLGELDDQGEADLKRIFFQGMTCAQAAEEQGVPLGTMKSRVRRSVLKLRGKILID